MNRPQTLDDLSPPEALVLLILSHNREGLSRDALNEAVNSAIAEHGSIEAAVKALRPKPKRQ